MLPVITRLLSLRLVLLSRHLHPRRHTEMQLSVQLMVLNSGLDHLRLLVHVRIRSHPIPRANRPRVVHPRSHDTRADCVLALELRIFCEDVLILGVVSEILQQGPIHALLELVDGERLSPLHVRLLGP